MITPPPNELRTAQRALGRMLAELRQAARHTQHSFAPLTHYGRSTIANVETGHQRMNRAFWLRCDELLHANGALVREADRVEQLAEQRHRQRTGRGEQPAPTHSDRAEVADTVEDVHRRKVLNSVSGVLGGAALGIPVFELLAPTRTLEAPRAVGTDHVERVAELAAVFEQWDNSRGGAIARQVADTSLRQAARLLELPCPPSLRTNLHTAMAQLAGIVGFMLFDAHDHDDAQKRFLFALQCVEVGQDWHQRAMLLSSLARQAVWCGQPDDGLTYIETALVRADRLTATERAMLHTVRAPGVGKAGPGTRAGSLDRGRCRRRSVRPREPG